MAKHSILVVEDEHTLRRLLEYRLGKQYFVRTAANGEEALTKIREDVPDLIVSDIMMPRMDGFALQQTLQSHRDTRIVPFIFLTAKADEQSRLKGLRTGVDDYITKPFDIDQLLSRIERLLERTEQFQTKLDAKIGQDFSQLLMPKRMPAVSGYRVHSHNIPLEHGGGDLLDWTETEAGVYFFTVGDVMGKGVRAKFFAFSFLAYVRSLLHGMVQDTSSPAELLSRINEMLIRDDLMEETFASLLLMRWEPSQHRVIYANAGHCRPILLTPDSSHIVTHRDLVLGLDPTTTFMDSTVDLPPGAALVAYTDGLIEQQRPDGKMLGEGGVLKAAQAAFHSARPIHSLLPTRALDQPWSRGCSSPVGSRLRAGRRRARLHAGHRDRTRRSRSWPGDFPGRSEGAARAQIAECRRSPSFWRSLRSRISKHSSAGIPSRVWPMWGTGLLQRSSSG